MSPAELERVYIRVSTWGSIGLIVGCCWLLASLARAADLTLTLQPPAETSAVVRILWGPSAAQLAPRPEAISSAATAITLTGIVPGTYAMAVEHTYASGAVSRSNVVSVQVAETPRPALPNPSQLVVTQPGGQDAFDLVKANNSLTLTKVGTVPAGTVCSEAFNANGYHLVDRAKVTLLPGKSRPSVVVARCGE